jgi:hypothetical protein
MGKQATAVTHKSPRLCENIDAKGRRRMNNGNGRTIGMQLTVEKSAGGFIKMRN